MTTFTSQTISRAVRGAVRAFVKSRPGFRTWIAEQGIDNRDVSNRQLLEFAETKGWASEVQQIIDGNFSALQSVAAAPVVGNGFGVAAVPAEPSLDREYFEAMRIEGEKLRAMARVEAAAAETAIIDMITPSKAVLASTASIDGLLAGVEPFLSPLVRAELEKALAPVIAAANKAPIIVDREVIREVEVEKVVTVEKTVTLDANGAVVKPVRPAPVVTGKVELGKLLKYKGSHGSAKKFVTLWDAHGAAPARDPYYVLDYLKMASLLTAWERQSNVWLVGPGGSGKTTLPEQACAFVGRPFTKIGFSKQSDVGDLVGGTGLANGSTKWDDGALIAAMKVPGMVILLDEITLAPAGVQGIIQGTADDHRTYTVHATGEVVKAAPGVVFVVADNTAGYGDETGQYAGTHQSNAALVNRFKRMIRIDYLTVEQETNALHNHCPFAPKAACKEVAVFFAKARKLPEMEGIVLSLRQMVGLVQEVDDGFSTKEAINEVLLTRLPATERAALEALATLQWAENFDKLMGNAVDQESGPSNSASAAAFDDDVSAALNR